MRHLKINTTHFKNLGLTFLVLFLMACNNKKGEKGEVIRPVFYQEINTDDFSKSLMYSGITQAKKETKLSFKVGGTLEKIPVKLGDKVEQGMLLAAINNSDYELKYKQALAGQKSAETQLIAAKSSFLRVEKLYSDNHTSLSEFERVKAQYEGAKSQMASAKIQVNVMADQMEYTKLKAPFSGIVSGVLAQEDEAVGPGKPIIILSSSNLLDVAIAVPENIIQKLQTGKEVEVSVSSLSKKFKGVITEIAFGSPQSSTYSVLISLLENNKELRPGLATKVEITFEDITESNPQILVPFDAVSEDDKGLFVYVLKKTSDKDIYIANRRNIKSEQLTNQGYKLKEGLQNKELIVTAGLSFMYDGRKVKLLE